MRITLSSAALLFVLPASSDAAVSVTDVVAATGLPAQTLVQQSGLTPETFAQFVSGAAAVEGLTAQEIGTIVTREPQLIPGIAVFQTSSTTCAGGTGDADEVDPQGCLPEQQVGFVHTSDPEAEDAAETAASVAPPLPLPAPTQRNLGDVFCITGKASNTLKSILHTNLAYVKFDVKWCVDLEAHFYEGPFILNEDANVTFAGYTSLWEPEGSIYTPEPDAAYTWNGIKNGGRRIWRAAGFKQNLPKLPDIHKTVNTKAYVHSNLTCTGCNDGFSNFYHSHT